MKTETILNKLLKLKENPYNAELLDNVINELKIDVYNESMGLKNSPQKKALKFLNDNKKRFSGCRSCLAYACKTIINGNDVQVFTDSYIAFILKTFYKLPLWDNEKEKNKYPEIERVLPDKSYGEMKVALIIDEKTDNQAIITPIRSYC